MTSETPRRRAERLEEELLSVAAARSARASRPYGEPKDTDDLRTQYSRDRDRILHSRAFRRLKHKTQVFIPFEGDHFRTRLTHTLEVAQIARSVARALRLNEDLTEAIALGHDLGHTPFGHSGEYILDALLSGEDPALGLSKAAAAKAGRFKHNYQSVRVVDRLEARYEHPGLNLTHDVREGLLKHTGWKKTFAFPLEFPEGLHLSSGGTLESQVVNWSDEIAQQAHDLEDGLPMVPDSPVEELEIARRIRGRRGKPSAARVFRAELVRGLYQEMISDLITASERRLADWVERERLRTPDDFERRKSRLPGDIVSFSPDGARRYRQLKEFVYRHIIHSFPIARRDGRARLVIRGLFVAFHENPRLLPDDVLRAFAAGTGREYLRDLPLAAVPAEVSRHYRHHPVLLRAIADYIAGMTDKFALQEYESLTAAFPSAGPL